MVVEGLLDNAGKRTFNADAKTATVLFILQRLGKAGVNAQYLTTEVDPEKGKSFKDLEHTYGIKLEVGDIVVYIDGDGDV